MTRQLQLPRESRDARRGLRLTTSSWLSRYSASVFRSSAPLLLCVLLSVSRSSADETTVEIRGVLDGAGYDPHTGVPHQNMVAHSTFVATLSGSAWRVCVTNLDRG